MNFFSDPKLAAIAAKIDSRDRLSFEDGVDLFATDDLNGLGKLADNVRRQKHGRTTYFNVNRHFNYTNVCYADCKFCGFFRTPRQPDAYTHNIEDSLRIAGEAEPRLRYEQVLAPEGDVSRDPRLQKIDLRMK